jgi:hypothetical protein
MCLSLPRASKEFGRVFFDHLNGHCISIFVNLPRESESHMH